MRESVFSESVFENRTVYLHPYLKPAACGTSLGAGAIVHGP